jgi:hypothetical protein
MGACNENTCILKKSGFDTFMNPKPVRMPTINFVSTKWLAKAVGREVEPSSLERDRRGTRQSFLVPPGLLDTLIA